MFCSPCHLQPSHTHTHACMNVGQSIKPCRSALWWVLCHLSDPRILLVDLDEPLPRGVHLPLLPTASWTINKTQGGAIQICRCCFDIAAQAKTRRNSRGTRLDTEQKGVAEGEGWGWPGDRWGRTCCQTGRRATESTAEGSKVLIYLLESGELSSWSHPSELLQGKSQASVGDFFLHFWWFFRPQVDAHIWGRLPLLSYRCVEGNGGDLSSLWCCSAVFSQSTG